MYVSPKGGLTGLGNKPALSLAADLSHGGALGMLSKAPEGQLSAGPTGALPASCTAENT